MIDPKSESPEARAKRLAAFVDQQTKSPKAKRFLKWYDRYTVALCGAAAVAYGLQQYFPEYFPTTPDASAVLSSGAFCTLVPIRPRPRGERRSLRTFAVVSLRSSLAFNPRPRRL
jgi:hypothetical protein